MWAPNGAALLLAELPAPDLGYNGDPDRVGDREAGDAFAVDGRMWLLPLGVLPDAGLGELALEAVADRATHNAVAFDRVWSRVNELYFPNGDNAQWNALGTEYRDRAVRAASETELELVVDEMLRRRPHVRGEVTGRAAVSSAHPLATEAGLDMLRRGGNVVDAAVAVSFAIGVVEPDASGIGGYGEMVLYLEGMVEPVVIEFLTRVPGQGSLDNAALLSDGNLPSDGPVLANVPGTVAGMWRAWSEFGSGNLAWSALLEPAIALAEHGFPGSDGFATTLSLERERYLQYDSNKELFFPGGDPLTTGDSLRNRDLAWTLRAIAEGGADALYRGEIARLLVEDLRGKGNAITLRDMDRYYAARRDAVRGEYHGHTIYSAAPASGGGASLVAKLTLLDNFKGARPYAADANTAHAMIEAWKLAPSMRIADPGLWPVDLGPATDRDAAQARWRRCFDPARSLRQGDLIELRDGEPACMAEQMGRSWGETLPDCVPGEEACRANGTTAFAVADAAGNIVSVTQTLGTWGGNFYVSPGLGFIYNDKLRSYSTNPDSYGARLPYARHGTSIAPTLVFRGTGADQQPLFAVGAAGNAWLTSALYQMVVAMIDGGVGPQAALEAPRFLIGRRRSEESRAITVQIEDAFAPSVLRELERMGHNLQRISLRGELRMGYGAAVLIEDGRVRAGGDPRRSGTAGAVGRAVRR
jgi:gamma-glutamyltranspeptidase